MGFLSMALTSMIETWVTELLDGFIADAQIFMVPVDHSWSQSHCCWSFSGKPVRGWIKTYQTPWKALLGRGKTHGWSPGFWRFDPYPFHLDLQSFHDSWIWESWDTRDVAWAILTWDIHDVEDFLWLPWEIQDAFMACLNQAKDMTFLEIQLRLIQAHAWTLAVIRSIVGVRWPVGEKGCFSHWWRSRSTGELGP